MKKIIKLVFQRIIIKRNFLVIIIIFSVIRITASDYQSITGRLIDQRNNDAVPYAVVSLLRVPESVTINSVYSDTSGLFTFKDVPIGNYKLLVTGMGYKPAFKLIVIDRIKKMDVGNILLEDVSINIKETEIFGDRLKAKSENNKTTFFITQKMLEVSGTGVDVLKLIPGIQFDLEQKVSLQGSKNVVIYVDGKERDRSFISQLNPDQIDKVEVISAPPSNYDGNATGIINIILKKDRDVGFNGQIYAEIPSSTSEVYLFPMYSFSYGFKKLNFYTSYNGDMIYFDVHESSSRNIFSNSNAASITSDQYVNQKDWSHKFHYGFDYLLGAHDQVNFYGYYNLFSDGRSGNVDAQMVGSKIILWNAKKEDFNINASNYYSLFYKHLFNNEGQNITLDINNFKLKANNSTDYISEGTGNTTDTLMNIVKPNQTFSVIKLDFNTPLFDKLKASIGIKAKIQELEDRHSSNFHYFEKIFATYASIFYQNSKISVLAGLRVEKSVSTLKNSFSSSLLTFLPDISIQYSLTGSQHFQLACNSSIDRPTIYQLNPYISISDPYTVYQGNPLLKPESHYNFFIEHSIQFNSNYFSSRLFYNTASGVINNLTFINDTNAFETQVRNSGTMQYIGLQFLGSIKFGIVTMNPYVRLYEEYTESNNLAKQYGIMNRHNPCYESGLSAILSFKHNWAFSFVFQYATPHNNIQGNTYCDPLYFVSIEKTCNKKIKLGMKSAFLFNRTFVYQGSDIESPDFNSHYKGLINMSTIPVWFNISYQFSSGKKRIKIDRMNEEADIKPKHGF